VEYRLVCRRTGEVVGMAYIRPQEEANLHNLLLGPEEEVVKREHNIEENEKTVDFSEQTNSISGGIYEGLMGETAAEWEQDVNITASQMVEVKMKDESGEETTANSKMMKKEADTFGQEIVVGPNFGLRKVKGDLGKPGLYGWQREVVYDEHTRSVTGVHYVTPPHPVTGLRRRCDINPKIQAFLDISGNSDLALDNFNLARKELGLGKDFEVCRKALGPGPTSSIYLQFFKEV